MHTKASFSHVTIMASVCRQRRRARRHDGHRRGSHQRTSHLVQWQRPAVFPRLPLHERWDLISSRLTSSRFSDSVSYPTRAAGLMIPWRRRWCVLKDETFMWFRSKQESLKSGWLYKKGGGLSTLSRRLLYLLPWMQCITKLQTVKIKK